MKATILSYIGFFLITIQLVVLGTLIAKSSYQQTIEQSVEESMDLAANMLKEGYAANREINMELLKTKGYVPDETTLSWSSSGLSDWKKEFVNYLSRNIDSRITDLSVNLYAADESKGILSAEATVTYKYLNGRIGTATCYKTIVLNTDGETSFDADDSGLPVASVSVAPQAKNLTYNGKEQTLVNKGFSESGTIFYKLEESGVFSKTPPTAIDAGNYTVYYMVKGDGEHTNSGIYSVPVTINKATPSYQAPKAKTLTYNGISQTLLQAGSVGNKCKIQYRLGDSGSWTDTIPSAKNAGTFDVYYRIKGTNNYKDVDPVKITVTIDLAKPTVKTNAAAKTGLIYNGAAQELITGGGATNGTLKYSLTKDGTYSASVPKGTNAGSYTVYMKIFGDANYDTVDAGSIKVTIAKATPTFITAPAGKTLSYSGSEQELVSAGRVTGGSLQYKISGGNYSTSIPKATYVGSYTVYYKVVGNKNWNDVTERSVTSYITDSVKPQISKATSVASSNFTNIGYGQGINMSLPDSSCHWARYMSLTYTFTVSDNVGVTGYYWGGVNPTNVNSVSWTAVSGNTITKTLNYPDSGTYYFAVRDGAGNIASVSCTAEFGERMMNQSSGSITNTKRLSKFAVNNCSGAPYISSSFDGHEATSNTGPVLYNVNGANANYTQSGTRTSCFLTYIFYD